MKSASFALLTLILAAGIATAASAAIPDGKVAVVRVTAIDGLADYSGSAAQTRSTAFSFDGSNYTIAPGAAAGLDGAETLVLIDRRKDTISGGQLTSNFTQEVRAVRGSSFEVKDLAGKVLNYQVAVIAGNLRLVGDGDQIVARGGENGPFQVWKVTGIDLVDRDAILVQ
jgi:hypothetical protein